MPIFPPDFIFETGDTLLIGRRFLRQFAARGPFPPMWFMCCVRVQTMTSDPAAERTIILEGLAALAVGTAEMGGTDSEIALAVSNNMTRLGLGGAEDLRAVVRAIGRLPQPLDQSAEERERRRPIEEMLGLTSAEKQLEAALRARQALESFANELDGQD